MRSPLLHDSSRKFRPLWLVFHLYFWTNLWAVPITVINDSTQQLKLELQKIEYLRDSSRTLSIQDFLVQPNYPFKSPLGGLNNSEGHEANYWVRFQLQDNSQNKVWILEFPDLHISHIEVYEGDSLIGKGGYLEVFETRGILHKNPSYLIRPGEGKTYYVKLQSDIGASFSIKLKSLTYFMSYSNSEYYFLGLYYGVLIIMALYNFFLFLKIKESVYLFYVFYVISCGLHTYREDGLGFQFWWPSFPIVNTYFKELSFLLLMLTFVTYSIQFLNLKKAAPNFYKGVLASVLLYLFSFLLFSLIFDIRKAHSILFLIPFFLVYFAAIHLYRKGHTHHRFFILAYSILILSLLIYILRKSGMLPQSYSWLIYNFNVGFILEVVIMSFALGDKFRIERNAKEQAQQRTISTLEENDKIKDLLLLSMKEQEVLKDKVNRELEDKVKERTIELAAKNKELITANEKLDLLSKEMERMNVALDKDNWQLNKKIKEKTIANMSGEISSFEEFLKVFPNELSCLQFISELKWKNGYVCKKCANTKYNKGEVPYSRKCSKCNYRESATTNTLFHRLKFDLNKAFYLTYLFNKNAKSVTLDEISSLLNVNLITCRKLKQKVKEKQQELELIGKPSSNWEDLIL